MSLETILQFAIVLPFAVILTWPLLLFVRMKGKARFFFLASVLSQIALFVIMLVTSVEGYRPFWAHYALTLTMVLASIYYAYRFDKSQVSNWAESAGYNLEQWRWVPHWEGPKLWLARGLCQIFHVKVKKRSGEILDGYLLLGSPLGLKPSDRVSKLSK